MEKAEVSIEEKTYPMKGDLTTLLRLISKPDALKLLHRAEIGIENSTYVIEEMGVTPKRYYARLKELIGINLIKKVDGAYRQTGLGRIIYTSILPTLGKAIDSKDELDLIVYLEGTELENSFRKRILDELGIPDFSESTTLKLLGDYEALAVEVIDLYDSAEESVLLASNYIDVRVMEACFRSVDRGVTNRLIVNKNSLSSNMQKLKMMLSLTFAKTIVNFASNKVDLREFVRFIDLPYTFCVVDGQRNIIDMSDTLTESFIVALSLNDKVISEKYTKFFERLWKAGETNVPLNLLDSIKSS